MQTIRVAAVSMNGWLGQPERVLDDIAAWCEGAAAEKVDLVLFPELVVHGHSTPDTSALAEPVPDGPAEDPPARALRRAGARAAVSANVSRAGVRPAGII
jgi:predicted amidohydrolase